jgi:hypothetical protein
MVRNNKSPSIKMVLSVDDRNKFASFFVVLIKIDKRKSKAKAARKKKAKLRRKDDHLDSQTWVYIFFEQLVIMRAKNYQPSDNQDCNARHNRFDA